MQVFVRTKIFPDPCKRGLKVQFVTHSYFCFAMHANPVQEFFFLLSCVRILSCGDNNLGAITCFLHTSCLI